MGLKELIDIGTCGLHTVHRSLQHGVEESEWIIKKLLNVLFNIFHESPSHRAEYEKLCTASEEDHPSRFCSHRWVENQDVSKRARTVWPKIVAIVEYLEITSKI